MADARLQLYQLGPKLESSGQRPAIYSPIKQHLVLKHAAEGSVLQNKQKSKAPSLEERGLGVRQQMHPDLHIARTALPSASEQPY
jgi:hypothetical protein